MKDNSLIPVVIGLILYLLLCGGCSSPKLQEYDFQEDNNLLYEDGTYASKGIKIEDILKKDTC